MRSWTSSLTTFLDELSNHLAARACREAEQAATAPAENLANGLSASGPSPDVDMVEAVPAAPKLTPAVRASAAQIVTRLAASAQYSKVSVSHKPAKCRPSHVSCGLCWEPLKSQQRRCLCMRGMIGQFW